MTYVLDIFKGMAIGIANVIPGFSGGTMAVILKVYERLIGALSEIANKPFKVIKEVWALVVGVVLGVVIASFTIIYALEKFPIQTIMFFVGLIIGSIPTIVKNIKEEGIKKEQKLNIKWVDVISFVVCVAVMIFLPLADSGIDVQKVNLVTLLVVCLMGLICAGAMIIPGVSGSLILMLFGYYILIIGNIKTVLENFISFNFAGMKDGILILIFFVVGAVVGLIGISKLIKFLLKKWPKTVYIAILGLLVASPFSIIYVTIQDYQEVINWSSPWVYIVGVLMLAIGGAIAVSMAIFDEKINNKKNEPNE